jgi:hypothetical protein
VAPDRVWECSHLGGDRFAGNLLVLPEGLGFGWVEPAHAPALVDQLSDGLLDLDLMRGRATLPMSAQFAEIQLRRELGELRVDALRYAGSQRDDDEIVTTFEVDGTTYDVRVRTTLGPAAPLTCGARSGSAVPRHEVTSTAAR